MTILSGFARSFSPLAFCRFGVAIGEAGASPAAFSMLYDVFSARVRATVLAIYSSGLYIGMGLGLFIGGSILDAWRSAWPNPASAPLGLVPWQAAFVAVGIPGLLMSLWVASLKEPERETIDGLSVSTAEHPFADALQVLFSMTPPINLWIFAKSGNFRFLVFNVFAMAIISLSAVMLISQIGNPLQWGAMAIGIYAVFSWAQNLSLKDPVIFGLIFKSKTIVNLVCASGLSVFMGASLTFWSIPYIQRQFEVSAASLGAILGGALALFGFLGVLLGGYFADLGRSRSPRGKLYVYLLAYLFYIFAAALFVNSDSIWLCYVGISFVYVGGALTHAPAISTLNDLMVPRGRATVSAFGFMVSTFLGGALGPFAVGFMSDSYVASGADGGEALRQAMFLCIVMPVVGIIFVIRAIMSIEQEEKCLAERARSFEVNSI